MKPLVERLKKQYEGKVEFRLLNVETDAAANDLAAKMGVQYVPTFMFVNQDGVRAASQVGELTEQQLVTALDALK